MKYIYIYIYILTIIFTSLVGCMSTTKILYSGPQLNDSEVSEIYHNKYTLLVSIDGKKINRCIKNICSYLVKPGEHKISVELDENSYNYEEKTPKGIQTLSLDTLPGERYKISNVYQGNTWKPCLIIKDSYKCNSIGNSTKQKLKKHNEKFVNLEAKGNLKSNYAIGCVPLTKLTNRHTPADIYPAFAKCIEENNLEDGARLFFLAGTYGRFDILRVTDKSAHQAIPALQFMSFRNINKDKRKTFMRKLKKEIIKNNYKEKSKICTEIKEFGYPKYYPSYMVQHGLNAFQSKNDNAIKYDFDAEYIWEQSLNGYMHCNNT